MAKIPIPAVSAVTAPVERTVVFLIHSLCRASGSEATSLRRERVLGIAVLVMGVLLAVLPFALGNAATSALGPISHGMRAIMPYAFLVGFALLVVYFAIRRKPENGESRLQPTLFGKDTTVFGPDAESRTDIH